MPSFTNSDVSYAKHTLDYPVYAADFDPYNRGYLIVAGGGGEGRSGVPNKIVRGRLIWGEEGTNLTAA